VVGAGGGVWLREMVDGRGQCDGGCATFLFKYKQNLICLPLLHLHGVVVPKNNEIISLQVV
jgi:hypothetical protein